MNMMTSREYNDVTREKYRYIMKFQVDIQGQWSLTLNDAHSVGLHAEGEG